MARLEETPRGKQRIVVVDDNMNDIVLVRRVLERAGYDVLYANSGSDGLRTAREVLPDCVLVDYRMPGMDGYEFCRQLKSDPILGSIPVLMLTGADAPRNVVEGLESGADDFVTKSSDIDVILARVRALLRVKAYQDRIVEQSEQLRRVYEELSQKSDRIMALNQRMNRDLEFARRVQEALLPERHIDSARAENLSAYIPSETLSGDFYDYFSEDDTLYIFMADVSGHGLPSAILVSLLKSFLHSEAPESATPAEFMVKLNDFLFGASLPSQFATALLLRLSSSGIEYSNAAHPPFIVLRRSTRKAELIEMASNLLGATTNMTYENSRLELESGDLLFTYTDGLTDRRNAQGEFFAIERIASVLEREAERDFSDIFAAVYEEVTSFVASDDLKDDIAFVLTRFK
jgi:serine phosphatase RsbU (regulator of sigma subunit)